MNITFNFKNFEPSEQLREYAKDRFAKLTKFLGNSSNADLQVNLSVEKFRQMAEVTLAGDYLHISAYEESEDMYSTVDLVLDKLEAQLRKMSEKKKDSHKKAQKTAQAVRMDVIHFEESDSGERERTIVETDSYEPKPMSVEEAAMQLDVLQYEFLVFLNAQTERLNVIYRRKNNDYGLIDPGF